MSTIDSYDLKQVIQEHTRITPTKSTLLDHIIVNQYINEYHSQVKDLAFSDHQAIILGWRTKCEQIKQVHKSIQFRSLKKYKPENLKADISNKDWTTFYQQENPNDCWSELKTVLTDVWNTHAPIKTLRIKQNIKNKPWVTSEILKLIKERNELSQKAKSTKSKDDWKAYKIFRNRVNNVMNREKLKHFRDKFDECSNPSDLWKPVKNLLAKKKASTQEIPEPEALAKFFTDYPLEVQRNIPTTGRSFWDFLGPRSQHNFSLKPVQKKEIDQIISKLSYKKAPGEDGLDNRLIKDSGDAVSTLLQHLFNLCISTCKIPNAWKTAKVSALHKKGDTRDPTNYRPISLLSTVSKIFEKLVAQQLTAHFETHHLFAKEQHGFRRKRSTLTSLLMLTDNIYNNIDHGKPTIAAFLDLSKAFDIVDTKTLLCKLEHYGIRGNSLTLLEDYLTSRNIFVSANGKVSNKRTIALGVPQGSILGPLMYIIYTNDFINCLDRANAYIYADDTALTVSNENPSHGLAAMQHELKNASTWFLANKLKLNTEKTQVGLFGTPHQLKHFRDQVTPEICINGVKIPCSKTINYLGVILDERLTFDDHIKSLARKLSRTLGILSNIKHLLPFKIRKTVYVSLVLSQMNYCSTIWCHTSGMNIQQLEKVLNRTCRCILGVKRKTCHKDELYEVLQLLPLKDRLLYNKAVDCYKVVTGAYDTPLSLVRADTVHPHNLRQKTLVISSSNTTIGKRKLDFMIPKTWNSFSKELKEAKNVSTFKAAYMKSLGK